MLTEVVLQHIHKCCVDAGYNAKIVDGFLIAIRSHQAVLYLSLRFGHNLILHNGGTIFDTVDFTRPDFTNAFISKMLPIIDSWSKEER